MDTFNRHKPIADGHDGHILRQMREGRPIPLIGVEPTNRGTYRFASMGKSIAAAIGNFEIRRMYRLHDDGSYGFFYGVSGELDHATIDELKVIAELLEVTFGNDLDGDAFSASAPEVVGTPHVKISFKHSMVYMYVELRFGKPWEAQDGFTQIVKAEEVRQ